MPDDLCGVVNKLSGHCCTLSSEFTGMQLDYIMVLFCAKDDVIIVPITSVSRLR